MNNMHESLALVQRRIALIERRGRASGAGGVITLGHDGIDRALGGGLGRGRLHEVLTGADQAASGAGFVAALAYRAGGKVLWLRDTSVEARMGRLYALGLTDIGVDPDRIVFGILPDAAAVLQAAVDALRCPALGAAVVELPGDPRLLDLTASRRLALAAEKSGVLALMLRVGGTSAPSAA
ncbi:MAG: ImuA family protein, partial [Sphingomonas sp.]